MTDGDDSTTGYTEGGDTRPQPKDRWVVVCPGCRWAHVFTDPLRPGEFTLGAKGVMCSLCGYVGFPWVKRLLPEEPPPQAVPPAARQIRRDAVAKPTEQQVKQVIEQEHEENKGLRSMWGDGETPFKIE